MKKKFIGSLPELKQIVDQFHYHEALDRTYLVGNMGEEFLLLHPVFLKHKKLKKKVEKALALLAEVYQEVGYLEHKYDKNAERH